MISPNLKPKIEIKICCNKLRKHQDRYNGGLEVDFENEINSPGCCGGGCYIMSDIKFCPWCGKKFTFVQDSSI